MECIIENCNFGNIVAENFAASVDTLNMCRVVKRSKVAKALDSLNNAVVNDNALVELVAALNYSVANSCDFGKIGNNSIFAFCEILFNVEESVSVVVHFNIDIKFSSVESASLYTAVNTDSFANTLCENQLVFHIDKLVLK